MLKTKCREQEMVPSLPAVQHRLTSRLIPSPWLDNCRIMIRDILPPVAAQTPGGPEDPIDPGSCSFKLKLDPLINSRAGGTFWSLHGLRNI